MNRTSLITLVTEALLRQRQQCDADIIGVNRATISHILSGRNKPSIDFLQKLLSSYPELNANWLISGVGDMKENQKQNEEKDSKSIGKVVVFYDDKSFDELNA